VADLVQLHEKEGRFDENGGRRADELLVISNRLTNSSTRLLSPVSRAYRVSDRIQPAP
jgi:hypothetical protein